jgi:hypothetical protein
LVPWAWWLPETLKVWEENRENEYETSFRSGTISAQKGALQIIFCDLGTPSKNTGADGRPAWTAYQQIKDQLVAGGIQAEQIRFIQDSPKPEQKAQLFAQCRSGEVAVLIGSTAMMGTGTNVQLRAKAIHHVTCPWRPADLTQRDGRIIRQGNANEEVHNFQYATVGSYDSAAWDGIQRKATMIQQVLRGRLDIREIEDVGDLALNAAQIKAATSGNPLVMEKIEADAARTKLERLKRAQDKGQSTLAWTRAAAETSITKAEGQLPALQAAIPRITPTAGDAFAARVEGTEYTKRPEAVAAISEWVRTHTPDYGNFYRQSQSYGTMATIGGHELEVRNAAQDSRLGSYQDLAVTIKDVPVPPLVFARMELLEGGAGIITRLENKVAGLPDYEAQLRQTIAEKQSVLADVESQAGKPFKYEDKLIAARAKSAELDEKLKASIEPPKPAPEQGTQAAEQEVAPDVARMRRLQAASFPTSPGSGRPPQAHPASAGPSRFTHDQTRNSGFER